MFHEKKIKSNNIMITNDDGDDNYYVLIPFKHCTVPYSTNIILRIATIDILLFYYFSD